MPMLGESDPARSIKVAASAPFELMWLFHNIQAEHDLIGPYATQEPWRRTFGPETNSFWGDGLRGATELVVLAHRTGTLLDLDLSRFFDNLEAGITGSAPAPTLLSETALEREAIVQRLARLKADADLRRRYIGLLDRVWDAASPEWKQTGRPASVAEADRWRRRLAEGASYPDIMDRPRLWAGRGELDELAESAVARGALVMSPGWFYGKVHVVELDGTVFIGQAVRVTDVEASYREVASHLSARIKALADPTRLSILMLLAHRPASVTEIARHFKLSQPTVSGHVQLLREAGLLDEKNSGRSAVLSASEDGVRRLFTGAQDSILNMFKS